MTTGTDRINLPILINLLYLQPAQAGLGCVATVSTAGFAEQGVNIAKLQAAAGIEQANGEAESIPLTGDAKADAYKAGVNALGSQAYTALQLMQVIGDRQVRVVPDVAVSGSNSSGLLDAMMGMFLWNQTPAIEENNGNSNPPTVLQGEIVDESQTH